jgi:predicted ATPase
MRSALDPEDAGDAGTPVVDCRRIVLTGGPGGGKTTLMQELHACDPEAKRWVLVPEAAPLVFRAGLDARDPNFEAAVVTCQLELEAAAVAGPGQVLVCHRGTLDPLAYWLRNGWNEEEFFTLTNTTRAEHFQRYCGVLHLQTAAIDAQAHYRRWPAAHRPETVTEAAALDQCCHDAWYRHPNYVLLTNQGRDWPTKAETAQRALSQWATGPPS